MAAKQGPIALGTNTAKTGIIHAPLVDILQQRLFGLFQLLPRLHPGLQLHSIFDQLLFSHLQRKIALGNQVTGVAGEHEIIDLMLPTLAESDQFRDATKMIRNRATTGLTQLYGTIDRSLKVLPAGIAERGLQITGEPEFDPLGIGPRTAASRLCCRACSCLSIIQILMRMIELMVSPYHYLAIHQYGQEPVAEL